MKQIIIAPYLTHESLLNKLRKDDPFQDIKLYSKQSFLNGIYYQYDERSLIYLMDRYDLDDELASKYLTMMKKILINSSENPKIQKLVNLRNELIEKGLFFKNDLFPHEMSQSEIIIYDYSSSDEELTKFAKNAKFFHGENAFPTYQCFETNQDELFYVFNKIRDLLDSGVSPNDIAIYGLSNDDELAARRMAKHFSLNINHFYPTNFYSLSYVREFLGLLDECGVEEAFEKVKEENSQSREFSDFEELVHRYLLSNNDPKQQKELYRSIFNKKIVRDELFSSAINVISEPVVNENGYLFIVNFIQGKYPIIKRDVDYLSNDEKQLCGIITTEQENTANLGYFSNLLQQNAHIYLTYSKRSFAGNLLKSPLIDLFGLKEEKDRLNTVYSLSEARLEYAALKDYMNNYLQDSLRLQQYITSGLEINYRDYDSQVGEISHYVEFGVIELSYSSMKTYQECAFKYFLGNILKVDDFDENYTILLGKIAHDIFQHIDELNNLSFDQLFEKYRSKYDSEFKPYDWIYFERSKKDLQKAAEFILKFESQIENPRFLREKDLRYNVDEHIVLKGRIDKAIFCGPKQDYIAVIDYKTGNEHFEEKNIQYGFSLQLPIYSLLLSKCYSDKEPIGLFIQKVLPDGAVKSIEENKESESLLLKGVFLDDIDKISSLDSFNKIQQEKSTYIKSCSFKDGHFGNSNRSRSKEWFTEKAQIAEDYAKQIGNSIFNNDFSINPKIIKMKNQSCEYCPFRDICFVQTKSYVYIGDEEDENGLD